MTTASKKARRPSVALSQEERTEFKKLDKTVRTGLRAGIEAGKAFQKIRDRELWRAGDYKTWDDYCQQIAGFSKRHANRLIQAAAISEELESLGPTGPDGTPLLPCSEAQIRPLAKLKESDTRAKAWHQAITTADGQPTAELVQQSVSMILAKGQPTLAKNPATQATEYHVSAAGSPHFPPVVSVYRVLTQTFQLKQQLMHEKLADKLYTTDQIIDLIYQLESQIRKASQLHLSPHQDAASAFTPPEDSDSTP